MKFRNILFPVDFSVRSHAAVPHVRAMANHFGASVTLLHVVEGPSTWAAGSDGGYFVEFDMPRLMKDSDDRLAAFAAADFPAGAVARMVEQGDPGSSIADLSKAWGTDLIMLPTHGRGTFRSALLGSVTAKVLHDARCAVWTGAHLEDADMPRHTPVQTVMCALDLEEGSLDLLKAAAHFINDSAVDDKRAVGYIVHSVPGAEAGPEMYMDMPLDAFLKDNARRQIARLQKDAGTAFGVCLEAGGVAKVVHNACQHHNADLVIIGRGVANRFAGQLRTHTYGIIRDAGCPVLSLPPREVIF